MTRRRLLLRLVVSLAVVVVLALTSQRTESLKAGLPSCPISLSATLMSVDCQLFGLGVVLFHPFLTGQVSVPRSARRKGPSNWPRPRLLRDASSLRASRS